MIEFPIVPKSTHQSRGQLVYRYNNEAALYVVNLAGRDYTVCSCHRFALKNWCDHARDLYTLDLDAGQYLGEAPLLVVFKDPTLLIQTTLNPVSGMDNLNEVHLMWGTFNKLGSGDFASSGGTSLGYIDVSKYGRAYIRQLFLEWVPSQFYENLECKSSWHTGRRSIEWIEPDDKDELKHTVRDVYSILDTESCAECRSVMIEGQDKDYKHRPF